MAIHLHCWRVDDLLAQRLCSCFSAILFPAMPFACLQLLARWWSERHLSAPNQCGNVAKIALLCKLQLCANAHVCVWVWIICARVSLCFFVLLCLLCLYFRLFFTIMFCCGNAADNKLFYCDIYLFHLVYFVYEFADR